MDYFEWLKIYTKPEFYIDMEISGHQVGVYFLLFIAFAEAGLLAGLLYSSDSFLFIGGIFSSSLINQLIPIHNEDYGVLLLAFLIALASVIGNTTAYGYGSKAIRYFSNKKDGWLFKRKYLAQSKMFFEKYGGWAIIAAHYVPIVRTFIPMLSAVSGMKFSRFATLISISSTIWSFSIILLGHYLYHQLLAHYRFDLKEHLWMIILVIIIVALVYLLWTFIRKKILIPKQGSSFNSF